MKIEIADTPSKQQYGLMFRKDIDDDFGMLFSFKKNGVLNFWGKNTYIPLDIAFISDDLKIKKISKIIPLSTKSVSSEEPCLYALETKANYFSKNNIEEGDKIKINNDNLFFLKD